MGGVGALDNIIWRSARSKFNKVKPLALVNPFVFAYSINIIHYCNTNF